MDEDLEISIIAPFFNEEATAEEFCRRVATALESGQCGSFEIIAINDGSHDSTGSILLSLTESLPALRYFELSINRGQTLALYAGVQQSVGKYVIIMDSDLQHLPEEIPLFIAEIHKGYDMVSGKRINRKESLILRKIPSLIANSLIRWFTGSKISDQGGFKCIRGDIARNILMRPGYHRFLPVIVQQMGGSISEIAISAPVREKGKSNYGISRLMDVLLDILMLWFESSGKTRPLYFLGKASLVLFMLATAIVGFLIVEKMMFGYPVANRPPFFGAILLYITSFLTFYHALTLELLSNSYRMMTGNKGYIFKIANNKAE